MLPVSCSATELVGGVSSDAKVGPAVVLEVAAVVPVAWLVVVVVLADELEPQAAKPAPSMVMAASAMGRLADI